LTVFLGVDNCKIITHLKVPKFLDKFSKTHQKMARKRVKKRTHVKKVENSTDTKTPKSFVIRTGKTTADPSSSVLAQLVLDVRKIMEPNTASRLRVFHFPPSPKIELTWDY
jgi:hypothetical protein